MKSRLIALRTESSGSYFGRSSPSSFSASGTGCRTSSTMLGCGPSARWCAWSCSGSWHGVDAPGSRANLRRPLWAWARAHRRLKRHL